jgi:hypothetical protein
MLTKPLPGVMDDPLHPLSQGCVCHLLFNEGSGSLAYDVSGHGNHGILKNMLPNTQGSKWQGSKFGGALDFDGQNDYVDCGNDPSLNITDAITIEAWVKSPDLATYRMIASKAYSYSYNGWAFFINNDGKLKWYIWDGSSQFTCLSTPTVDDGNFHHFVGTWSGGQMKFYIDGTEPTYDTQESPSTIATTTNHQYIGKWHAGSSFNGSIGGVKIYNRALSVKEIKQLYHDPFCNLIQVPAWQLYSPAVGGLSIPVAMHHYEALRV